MAEGKKKKRPTTVPLGEFLSSGESKADWADVSDEDGDREESQGGHEERRSDYRSDDRYGDRRGGYRSDNRGDRYGDRGGDRYGDRGDRYGDRGSRYNDRGDRYSDRGDRYGDDRGQRRNDRGGRPRYDAPQKEAPQHPPFIAFVGNLDFSVDEPALVDFFSEHCQVKNARLLLDRQTGRSRGYGYVTFEDRDSLVAALEANGVDLSGRPLRVDVAEERPESDRPPRGDRPAREPAPPSRADQVDKWERGKPVPKADKPEREPRRDNRGPGPGPRDNQRKPLNLQPRSESRQSDDSASGDRKHKSNPFGDAKPRDEAYYQKKKEEEWAKRGEVPPSTKKGDDKGGKSQNRSKAPPKAKEESKPVETTNLYAVLEEED